MGVVVVVVLGLENRMQSARHKIFHENGKLQHVIRADKVGTASGTRAESYK